MVTMVGKSMDMHTLLRDLLVLEFDAIEAYNASIERLEDTIAKQRLSEFVQDHHRHVQDLTALIQGMGQEAPTEPDAKAILTKGKVVLANLMGDKAILAAMKTNEDDTVTAYERALKHENLPPSVREVFSRGFADETRHRAWMESAAGASSQAA